ncbi:MAG: CPBP family intramembrane metalloprotease [Anaerolineales bacterium]|nr:CPBP family intramembrane metalloprotease [Anaerolineales bacterium]
MRSITQRYPLVAYYLLTLILSGVIFVLLFAAGLVEGLFFLGTFGPGLAAILVTLLISGRTGVKELLGSLLIWRVAIQWWLVALLLPALIVLGAVYLFSLFGGPGLDFSRYQPLYSLIPMIILITLLNGVGEELGWRGFMLPRLQSRYNALVSSLIVGFFWGLWHAPVYFIAGHSPVHLTLAGGLFGRIAALHLIYDGNIDDLHLGFQQHARQCFDCCFAAWRHQRLDELFPDGSHRGSLGHHHLVNGAMGCTRCRVSRGLRASAAFSFWRKANWLILWTKSLIP